MTRFKIFKATAAPSSQKWSPYEHLQSSVQIIVHTHTHILQYVMQHVAVCCRGPGHVSKGPLHVHGG